MKARSTLPAWALALLIGALALWNLASAQQLRSQLTRDYAQQLLRAALRGPLGGSGAARIEHAATALVHDTASGIRFLAVRDAAGSLRASAGAFENLGPQLPARWRAQLRDWAYRLTCDYGHAAILSADGTRTLGGVDYAVASGAGKVHDSAVRQLLWSGWLALAAALLLAAWALLARRGGTPRRTQAKLARRLSEPHAAAPVRPTPEVETQIEGALQTRVGEALDQLDYGVILTDSQARVRFANRAAERLTGWPLADARERPVYSVFHALDDDHRQLTSAAECALQQRQSSAAAECQLRVRDGSLRRIEMMASLLHAGDGSLDGSAMLFRDIAPRQQRVEALQREARLSQGVIDHLEEGLLTTDPAGVVRFANARALRMFGYAREELDGVTVTKLMPVPFLNTPQIKLTDYAGARNARKQPRVVGWRRDATTFPAELQVQPLNVEGDSGLIVIVRDISERLRSENLATRLGRLLDSALEEVYIFDAQSLYFLEVNRGARKNLGYRQEQLARMTPLNISPKLPEAEFSAYLNRLRSGEAEHLSYRCVHQRADGSEYPVEVRLNFSREEEPPVFMAIVVDISERISAEERLRHLAHHDALTGLPSRTVLHDRLQQALLAAQRGGRMLAVYFVDLDLFKSINDRYGHEVGDAVLRSVAERLKSQLRAADTVARLSGDEFVVIAAGVRDSAAAEALAQKIVESFRHRLDLPGQDIVMTVSVGVAIYPVDETNADALLRHADSAMYQAKQAGRSAYRMFGAVLDPARRRQLELEREIHSAVALNQYRLMLAPVLDARARVRAGLVDFCWDHPRYGRVGSAETVRAAIRAGLLADLELWLICSACGWHDDAARAGLPVIPIIPIIVGISGWQLRDGAFADQVLHLLTRFSMPPGALVLALTQEGMAEAGAAPPEHVAQLAAHGVRFALRDFSGSLSALKPGALPFERVLLSPEVAAAGADDAPSQQRLRDLIEAAAGSGREVIVPAGALADAGTGLAKPDAVLRAGGPDLATPEGAAWLAQQQVLVGP